MTRDEIDRTWYSKAEYQGIRRDYQKTVLLWTDTQQGKDNGNQSVLLLTTANQKDCFRGLESRTIQGYHRRRDNKFLGLCAVLDEQQRQQQQQQQQPQQQRLPFQPRQLEEEEEEQEKTHEETTTTTTTTTNDQDGVALLLAHAYRLVNRPCLYEAHAMALQDQMDALCIYHEEVETTTTTDKDDARKKQLQQLRQQRLESFLTKTKRRKEQVLEDGKALRRHQQQQQQQQQMSPFMP